MRRFLAVLALAASIFPPAEAAPVVAASIRPVHALVAAVMEGLADPELIVPGTASPHSYSLRPSDAAALARADVVFWIGPEFESFLTGPIANIAAGARSVPLVATEGLLSLPYREDGPFSAAGEDADAHGHEEDGHDHDGVDGHVWLDPVNAGVLVGRIGSVLSEIDPANADTYAANAGAVRARLEALDAQVRAALEPVRTIPFIVFHDGYQYFERRYGLNAVGSITVNPEVMPGAERLREIRRQIETSGVACVFAEPQFDPKLVSVIIEGTDARGAAVDPLGAALTPGPGLYFRLITEMAEAFSGCLSAGG
jgi:zinc transport system substrate-binding protein